MRKTTTVTLEDRGNTLTFEIREMSVIQLERWIARALLAIGKGGAERIPTLSDMPKLDTALLVQAVAGLEYETAEPLLNEMLACCCRVDGNVRQQCTPDTVEGYIEDVTTLVRLRIEALKWNFAFLTSAAAQDSQEPLRIGRPQIGKGKPL